eukprot:2324737-Rhodomonas_salina.1
MPVTQGAGGDMTPTHTLTEPGFCRSGCGVQLLVGSGFRLEVANLRSLPTMHNHRSRTVADILVHPA